MNFPLSLFDFGLWLAITAIILLITTEIIIPYLANFGNVMIERKRLRLIAISFGIAFMAIVLYYSFNNPPQTLIG